QAQHRIKPFVQQTPLISSGKLNNIYEGSIYLKLENLHETGAFKLRGAANKLLSNNYREIKWCNNIFNWKSWSCGSLYGAKTWNRSDDLYFESCTRCKSEAARSIWGKHSKSRGKSR